MPDEENAFVLRQIVIPTLRDFEAAMVTHREVVSDLGSRVSRVETQVEERARLVSLAEEFERRISTLETKIHRVHKQNSVYGPLKPWQTELVRAVTLTLVAVGAAAYGVDLGVFKK